MSQPLLPITNAPKNLCETTISLSGTVFSPISMGYLGLDKLLHDKTTLRIMSKISFDVYERLDARVMQIIMNEYVEAFEEHVLPNCKDVERLHVSIEFRCNGSHNRAKQPCLGKTNLKPGEIEDTVSVLRVGLLGREWTKLLPGNLELRVFGDHFPVMPTK
ncbi:hypothetical protein C8Q74DRAFT_1451143 [Fomes fomentarius]|nr:hypothetical protein C8Q74DRAFT_1451143 [Fomes fomentarius]